MIPQWYNMSVTAIVKTTIEKTYFPFHDSMSLFLFNQLYFLISHILSFLNLYYLFYNLTFKKYTFNHETYFWSSLIMILWKQIFTFYLTVWLTCKLKIPYKLTITIPKYNFCYTQNNILRSSYEIHHIRSY